MKIAVVRHCTQVGEESGFDDVARPLSEHGRAEAKVLGMFLGKAFRRPTRLVTSRFERARETARVVEQYLAVSHLRYSSHLAPGKSPEELVQEIGKELLGEDTAVLIGHQPQLSRAIELLFGVEPSGMLVQPGAVFGLGMSQSGTPRLESIVQVSDVIELLALAHDVVEPEP